MVRADPKHAADVREQITGKREDPTEQAWSVGPWPTWMASKQVEDFIRNIPWAIEVVLGSYRITKDGMDVRLVKLTSKEPPPTNLPKTRERWFMVIDNITVYIAKFESRWPVLIEATQDTQIQSGPSTRKLAADKEKDKLPFFKIRIIIIRTKYAS